MPNELGHVKFREFFVHIGMLNENQAATDSKESHLVHECWANLTSHRNNENIALVEDLKVIFMAILRLNDGKIITLERPSEKLDEKIVGFINQDSKL